MSLAGPRNNRVIVEFPAPVSSKDGPCGNLASKNSYSLCKSCPENPPVFHVLPSSQLCNRGILRKKSSNNTASSIVGIPNAISDQSEVIDNPPPDPALQGSQFEIRQDQVQ